MLCEPIWITVPSYFTCGMQLAYHKGCARRFGNGLPSSNYQNFVPAASQIENHFLQQNIHSWANFIRKHLSKYKTPSGSSHDVRLSSLFHGNFCTDDTTFLCWNSLLGPISHIMMMSSNGHIFRGFTWSFDVFFDLRLNKCLNKQSRSRWFEMQSHSLRHHSNAQSQFNCIFSHQDCSIWITPKLCTFYNSYTKMTCTKTETFSWRRNELP